MKQRTSTQTRSSARGSMATRRTRSTLPATTRRAKAPAAKRKSAGNRANRTTGPQSRASNRSRSAEATTDHREIQKWVESHGGQPTIVKGTSRSGKGEGILRIDFPGFSGAGSLKRVSWNEWFKIFDQRRLAFLHQRSKGKQGRFNKLVSRTK